jgi:hypothetical protein
MRGPILERGWAVLLSALVPVLAHGQIKPATCVTNPDTAAAIRTHLWQVTQFPPEFGLQQGLPYRPGRISQVDDDHVCARAARAVDALYPPGMESPRWDRVVVLRIDEARYVVTGPDPSPQYHVVFDSTFHLVSSWFAVQ